jgi:hypothetical protein
MTTVATITKVADMTKLIGLSKSLCTAMTSILPWILSVSADWNSRLRMNVRPFPSVSFGEIELISGGTMEFEEIMGSVLEVFDNF